MAMKTHNSVLVLALTVCVCVGAASLAFAQSAPKTGDGKAQMAKAPTFNVVVTDGHLRLNAQRQEANGMLRNVTVQTPTSYSSTDPSDVTFGVNNSTRIFAQYARPDKSRPGQWLLGKGVIQHFRPDGTMDMESKFDLFHAYTSPGELGYSS